jgi:thioredoxin:protein disulfide reductase
MGRDGLVCRVRADGLSGMAVRFSVPGASAALRSATIALTLILAAAFGLPSTVGAQNIPKPSEIVKIQALKLDGALKPGNTSTLEVDAEILPGWHINSNHPNSSDFIPTILSATVPAGLKAGPVGYPPAGEIAPAFSGGEKLSVFTGRLKFDVPLSATPSFRSNADDKVSVTLDYQPCNDNICLPPAKVSASEPLQSLQPAASSPSKRTIFANAFVTRVSYTDSPGQADPEPSDSAPPAQELADTFFHHGLLLGLLAVLLGGLALNLTPCVYPLVGVTIAYFGNQGGGPRKIAVLAVIYVLGIALTFSAAGVAVALSGGLFGEALQNPYVLGGIAAVLLVLAASSFGLYSLQPPQWLMRRAGAARPGYVGALVMGLGMGVVAAPCIGPIVLGLLLMVERSASPIFGLALFFTLAVGLGLPYIALALAAGSIRRLPRSGKWLAWVEQFFGFVLVGLALYFLDPLAHGWTTWVLPYYAVAAGVFLGFITSAGRRWRPFLVFRTAIGALSLGVLAYLLLFPAAKPAAQLSFDPYDNDALMQARAEHKPVVIDFSADWCIPCREMRRTTFRDPAVIEAASHFVRLEADVTETNRRTKELLSRFEIRGVPTSVFIDKHGKVLKREVGYVDARQFLDDLREIDEVDGLPEVEGPPRQQTIAASSWAEIRLDRAIPDFAFLSL